MSVVAKDIAGEDQWTDPIRPADDMAAQRSGRAGFLNVSIRKGSWVGKITLKRIFPEWSDYEPVTEFEKSIQTNIYDPEPGVQYIIGCESGDYTSGTIPVRLSK